MRGWLVVFGILVLLLSFPVYAAASLWYGETKGPFKNWLQVVDWEADGDLDLIVSHTRWEALDISWAGIGIWLNQGDGTFELIRDRGTGTHPFGGFAAGAGDVDQDGDLDVFTQDYEIRLMVNQGGFQEGEPGRYLSGSGIETPAAYDLGYRDMGGMIVMGDLNGDGMVDAFVSGCCYGLNAAIPGDSFPHAPSLSWAWINDGWVKRLQTGHIIPMDSLEGKPIRQAALGDVDGDGDLDMVAAVGKPTLGTVDSLDDLILLNDGTGRLEIYKQPLGNTDSTSAAVGDVNGDGRPDVLVGTDGGARLWINQGNGVQGEGPLFVPAEISFEARQTVKGKLQAGFSAAADKLFGLYLPYGSLRTMAVFLKDLDGDGDLDALLARLWAAEVWWNDGQGSFSHSDTRLEYREDTGFAAADLDGDGDQDIFAGRNEDDYQVWWNDGQGDYSP